MANILVKGTTYASGTQVTSTNLNAHVDSATFDTGAVDNSTTAISGGAIIVKDAGVTMAKMESASNGQLPIGNGSGFTKAVLTAGTNIAVTNAAGAITVGLTGAVAVTNGGTGATSAAGARTALGIAADEEHSDLAASIGVVQSGTTGTGTTNVIFNAAGCPSVTLGVGTWMINGSVGTWLVGSGQAWGEFYNNTDAAAFGGSGAMTGDNSSANGGNLAVSGVLTVASSTKTIYFRVSFGTAGAISYQIGAVLNSGSNLAPAGFIQAVQLVGA